ncbi:hypothetical protein QQX98_006511 [Neonectria punicea]|uniref:Protamine P1 n=1 Tax=Neonectria punicea TaxID=979145 RepID=A0ABR1H0P1_9HYPO
MQHVDRKVDQLEPSWEEDTIYCEATCAPEGVFYEGSDDEDYDDPTCRRLRYEAAGQRFLDGCTPLLLTATLKGPFDKSSGWTNPWQSKHRTARAFQGTRSSPDKLSRQPRRERNMSIPETIQIGPHDSMECHLPSPESLKQAPVEEEHPYLEDAELEMVQKWRTTVQPVAKDQFWASTPKENKSDGKRKAKGSEWLRKVATKRRRTELMESGSINSPITRISEVSRQDHSGGYPRRNISFTSVPGQLPSSAKITESFMRIHTSQNLEQDAGNNEETVDSITVSFTSAPGRLQTPTKRISPKRSPKKCALEKALKESKDMLSKNEAASIKAAATLSSPVSQKQFSQASVRKSPRLNLSQRILNRHSPSRPTFSLQQAETVREEGPKENESVDGSEELETQRDQSFCFRMRPRPTDSDDDQVDVIDQTNASSGEACGFDDTKSWSGLSSMDDEEVEQLRVAEDDSAESKVSSSKIDPMSTALETGTMRVDTNTMSSELSSLASEDFAGFDIGHQSETDVEMQSDSDTSSGSETASDGSSESGDTVEVAVMEVTEPTVQQDISHNESASDIHAANTEEQSVSEDGATEEDASEESGDESENDGTDNSSSQGSDASDAAPEARLDPCKSAPLHLLKDSVRRLVPKTLWARMSHSSSPALTLDHEIHESSHFDAALEESPQENSTLKEELDEPAQEQTIDNLAPENQVSSGASPPPEHGRTVLGLGDAMEVDETGSSTVPLPVSQQSPWAESKLSQFAKRAENVFSPGNSRRTGTPQRVEDASTIEPSAIATPQVADLAQEPIATQDGMPNVNDVAQLSPLHPLVTASSTSSQMQNHAATPITPAITPAMAPRPSTPEPQFSVKSFASFMSPSPERRARKSLRAAWQDSGSRLPSTQGILASATKNPWKADVSQRRVSWAPLPHEVSISTTSVAMPPPLEARGRQVSPPPTIPIAELPTSGDAKFHEHFTAVANRTKGLRQRILPTASQHTLGSPEAQAMAETFLSADQLRKSDKEEQDGDNARSHREPENVHESQEPLDIVEDVIREMGGYLNAWDVDMELDQARKTGSFQAPQLTQSPW